MSDQEKKQRRVLIVAGEGRIATELKAALDVVGGDVVRCEAVPVASVPWPRLQLPFCVVCGDDLEEDNAHPACRRCAS